MNILSAATERYAVKAYDPERQVPEDIMQQIYGLLRHTPSSVNSQPWHFIVATQDQPEDYARILDALVPQNQAWAKDAYLLGISTGKRAFAHNGSPNRYNLHDAGAALMSMAIQATNRMP